MTSMLQDLQLQLYKAPHAAESMTPRTMERSFTELIKDCVVGWRESQAFRRGKS